MIGPAPLGAGTAWKAAGDGFFASRCKAEGGGKKLAMDVAGRRARRSRSSVRPCQSRTRMERPFQEIVGIRQMAAVCAAPGTGTLRRSPWLRPFHPDLQGQFVCCQWAFAGAASSTFAGAGVSGVAERPLAGRHALPRQAGRSEFPGADLPARRSGRKAQPRWPAVATMTSSARLSLQPNGACREMSAADLALWD